MAKKTALITVTYNSEKNLSFFLPSIINNKDAIDALYFVDNNSKDKTLETINLIKSKGELSCPVIFFSNKKNYGYARAINIGIKKALEDGYELILVTNNDIIFSPGAISLLNSALLSQQADAVGVPAGVNTEEFGIGYHLDKLTWLPVHIPLLTRHELNSAITQNPFPSVDFVHGGTILFKRSFFEKVGLYDDQLFFGGDELDFLFRVAQYNKTHSDQIKCIVSLEARAYVDNLTKHNNGHKLLKASRILQGTTYVYLKHRFTPAQVDLYKILFHLVEILAKKRLLRYLVLIPLALRAFFLESSKFYAKRLLGKDNAHGS